MKVLAVISRDFDKGSTQYRLAQYLKFLSRRNVVFEFVRRKAVNADVVKKAAEFDLVFNQKCLFKYSLARKLINHSVRTLFDFDDAIYTRPYKPHSFIANYRVKRRLHLWLSKARIVTTPNQYLAAYARKFSRSVKIVPMALDMTLWKPAHSAGADTVTIGWAGAPVNVPLLEKLDAVLSAILEKFQIAKLAVFSGEKPKLSCSFEYHPYRPGREVEFVRSLDIGLLPLLDDEHARGKSPIKALQYLACGIPVVGNVIGATAEMLNAQNSIAVTNESDWAQALAALILNREMAQALGRMGRKQVETTHNLESVAEDLHRILIGV